MITYVDRLVANFEAVCEGNAVRALSMAIVSCELDRVAGGDPHRRVIVGGLDFLDGVLVLLRDRLSGACSEAVPYVLTEAGWSA